jgi:hypothetical protein
MEGVSFRMFQAVETVYILFGACDIYVNCVNGKEKTEGSGRGIMI